MRAGCSGCSSGFGRNRPVERVGCDPGCYRAGPDVQRTDRNQKGTHATVEDRQIKLRGLVASLDGKTVYKSDKTGPVHDAHKLGHELGQDLLKMGADKILQDISR